MKAAETSIFRLVCVNAAERSNSNLVVVCEFPFHPFVPQTCKPIRDDSMICFASSSTFEKTKTNETVQTYPKWKEKVSGAML